MNFWIKHEAGCPMAVRSTGDPFDDPDVVVEYWGAVSRQWIVDANLSDEMFWNPHFRRASKADIDKLTVQWNGCYPDRGGDGTAHRPPM